MIGCLAFILADAPIVAAVGLTSDREPPRRMPDYRGTRWDRAQKRANAAGFTDQEDYDAAADNSRHTYKDSNWVVAVQKPAPGAKVKSRRAKFGRVKTVEAAHFIAGVDAYVSVLAPQPRRPTNRNLITAAIAFCDRLYGSNELNARAFDKAEASFARDLAAAGHSTKQIMRPVARAAAGPAVAQFCGDARKRVPSDVTTTTSRDKAPAITPSTLGDLASGHAARVRDEKFMNALDEALTREPNVELPFTMAQLTQGGHAFCAGLVTAHATVFGDFDAVAESLRHEFVKAIVPSVPNGDILMAYGVGQAAIRAYCPSFTPSLG